MKTSKAQRDAVNKCRATEHGRLVRYKNRKAYYARTQHLTRGRRRWSDDELEILKLYDGLDEDLAYIIHRSVASIQTRRYRLLQEAKK